MDNGTYCRLQHNLPFDEYMAYAEKVRKQSREEACLEDDESVRSSFFISAVPWLHYSALIQPVAGGEESNPRITWDKAQKDFNGRDQMPVTVLVHHGLADGIHIAQFYQNIEKRIHTDIQLKL